MEDQGRFILSRKAAIAQHDFCKRIADIVSYSYKTNTHVGKIVEEETDCMLTVHMHETLGLISDMGRVWFCAQGWDADEIKRLVSQGIRNFIIDNIQDLDLLLDALDGIMHADEQKLDEQKLDEKLNLLLRMRLKENTIHTGKYYVFGMYSEQINRLIPELRKNKNIGMLGVHFHRKTQNISEWSLKAELEQCLSDTTLDAIDLLNIGGGMPVRYKNYRAGVMEHILGKIKELREWLNSRKIQMMIEPGRFIAAPAARLETEIKCIYDDNIIVNCSVYNSAMDTIVANIRLLIEGELPDGKGKAYTVKGSTPCSMDIFRYRAFLEEPRVGDKIVFLNAGAYNFTTDFCNLTKPETVIVD
ncbi:decarboxylase [Candidatus Woesearchaeota archaeon]|nr:decarboxylase [Candidatus Woesearchaeota archaeon]